MPISDIGTAPKQAGWSYVCELPEKTAFGWALKTAPYALVGKDKAGHPVDVEDIHEDMHSRSAGPPPDGCKWNPGTYAVVWSGKRREVAVYLTPGMRWFLIKRKIQKD